MRDYSWVPDILNEYHVGQRAARNELAARESERDEARDLAKLLQMVLLRSYEWVGFAPRTDRPEDADATERLRQDVARAVEVARARTRGW